MTSTMTSTLVVGQTALEIPILAVLVIVAIIFLAVTVFMQRYFGLWFQALLSNAKVEFMQILGMRFRRVDPRTVVLAYIRTKQAGLDVPISALETHYLAGGDVARVTSALIEASRAGLDVPFEALCAIDLAAYDVQAAVRTALDHGIAGAELADPGFVRQLRLPRVEAATS